MRLFSQHLPARPIRGTRQIVENAKPLKMIVSPVASYGAGHEECRRPVIDNDSPPGTSPSQAISGYRRRGLNKQHYQSQNLPCAPLCERGVKSAAQNKDDPIRQPRICRCPCDGQSGKAPR